MLAASRRSLSVWARYSEAVAAHTLKYDDRQAAAVAKLDQCLARVAAYANAPPGEACPRVPRGLYLHGCVGSGKSMLMDMFHATAAATVPLPSRRVHFNAFMLEVHGRVHAWKQDLLRTHGRDMHVSLAPVRDAIGHVANALADEARLLCFDEFQVCRLGMCACACLCAGPYSGVIVCMCTCRSLVVRARMLSFCVVGECVPVGVLRAELCVCVVLVTGE